MNTDIPAWLRLAFPRHWPVQDEVRVQRKLRYSLIGAIDYAAALIVMFSYAVIGVLDWREPTLVTLGVLLHNLLIFAAVASGKTMNLPDPWVAGLQIGTAYGWTLLAIFLMPEIGILLLASLMITSCFASLNLRRKHFLVSWLALYGALIWVLLQLNLQIGLPMTSQVEQTLFIFFAAPVYLARIFLINAEIAHSRQHIQRINHDLQNTREALNDSRQSLAVLIDHLPVAVFVFDPAGRLRMANRMARQLTSPDACPPGTPLTEVAAQFTGMRLLSVHQTQMAETEVTAPNGRRCIATLSPLFSALQSNDTVLILSDITAVRSAEIQREETLHFLSHDLRAPLSAAISLMELSSTTRGPQHTAIQTNLRHSLSLAEDFVLMARAARAAPKTFREVQMADVVLEAAELLQPTADQRGIRVDVDLEGDTSVFGDWSLLLRAMTNLLSNAISFSPAQGTVSVRTNRKACDVIVSVADEGPGFPQEVLAQLFSPQHGTRTVGNRVGLGLLLVHQVAQSHGGSVRARNRSKAGARVDFMLLSHGAEPSVP